MQVIFTDFVMDFKTARTAAGLTLQQAAQLSGYGVATINGLEKHGEGSDRLKKRLGEVYRNAASQQETAGAYVLRESAVAYGRAAVTLTTGIHNLMRIGEFVQEQIAADPELRNLPPDEAVTRWLERQRQGKSINYGPVKQAAAKVVRTLAAKVKREHPV
jgi:hypothetical protein